MSEHILNDKSLNESFERNTTQARQDQTTVSIVAFCKNIAGLIMRKLVAFGERAIEVGERVNQVRAASGKYSRPYL